MLEPSPQRAYRGLLALAFALSLVLLALGVERDWCLLHEDNGALHTTFALSHLHLGLGATRAHDVFFDPATGERHFYGHHPAAVGLLLALAFRFAGSAVPAVARGTVIVFQLGSLLLAASVLRRLLGRREAVAGAFVLAVLPMGAFFGRMVNYEPLCLFFVLLELLGYVLYREDPARETRALFLLGSGVFLGGLVDWGPLFFAAAIVVVDVAARRREEMRRTPAKAAAIALVSAAAAVAVDLAHLRWATGSLATLLDVSSRSLHGRPPTPVEFVASQVEFFRRYLTHAGLIASVAVLTALILSRKPFSRRLLESPDQALLRDVLAIVGGGAAAYVLAAPSWASIHPYWQFYFLPFVVLAIVLAGRSLWTPPNRWRRALCAIFVLEILGTSAYTLHLRHTRVGEYAVKKTAEIRAQNLPPPAGTPCGAGR
ncbi:MAG TPA: glycosyltransferase family 39 protein [Thermoanaerobaculia bacterium]|nr:glycosyltransferase family 39 protein [Thermoanaerobaculia bacterium]